MDDELFGQLTDSEKDSWQKLQNTLSSPGYVLIKRDLEEVYESLRATVFHAPSWEAYHRLLGQIEGLEHILSVEDRALMELSQAVMDRGGLSEDGGDIDAFA